MRQRILSIWSVLLVLVVSTAVLIPGCGGGPGGGGTAAQCTIVVDATLDGSSWSGFANYHLTGPGTPTASTQYMTVPRTHSNVVCGSWNCTWDGVGPVGASFIGITPSATQTVFAGTIITFTLNFLTQPAVLDHFKGYAVQGSCLGAVVQLADQFGAVNANVTNPRYFCNPVAKTHDGSLTPISNPDHHLALYDITYTTKQYWRVKVDNQFGVQELTVAGPLMVAVPTKKGLLDAPVGLDHFLLYEVLNCTLAPGTEVSYIADLEDQWHLEEDVELMWPAWFANPVQKTDASGVVTQIENPDEHLVFYYISGDPFSYPQLQIANQFGQQTFDVYDPELLAVASEKISSEQFEPEEPTALDHFDCYWTYEEMYVGQNVHLEDQFGAFDATVEESWYFCTPVEKERGGVVTPISDPDDHLTVYWITLQQQEQYWQVGVDNQFGIQQLTVRGPICLAVPTQKVAPGNHEPPVGLDHFLLYSVEGTALQLNEGVNLHDQFTSGSYEQFMMTQPLYFANPVQKTDAAGMVAEIQNPDDHLLFFELSGQLHYYPLIQIVNQFGGWTFPQVEGPWLLAVPSQKTSWQLLPL